MLDFETLDNLPNNQRIDLPFIVYQSKPKPENQRIMTKNSHKYGFLLPLLISAFMAIWFIIEAIIRQKLGILWFAFLCIIMALIMNAFYQAFKKHFTHINKLANENFPSFFPFIEIDNEHFKLYDRDTTLKFDLPINELKRIQLDNFKTFNHLTFYFKHYQKNTKDYIISLHDIDFYIQLDGKNYYLSGAAIVYFVDYIRFIQGKSPNLDHVNFNKKHFMNNYPISDKYL